MIKFLLSTQTSIGVCSFRHGKEETRLCGCSPLELFALRFDCLQSKVAGLAAQLDGFQLTPLLV